MARNYKGRSQKNKQRRNDRLQPPANNGPGFINPYNFVRWGSPAPRVDPFEIGQAITHEKFSGLSGCITCEIEVLTPMAIPDTENAYPDPSVNFKNEETVFASETASARKGKRARSRL